MTEPMAGDGDPDFCPYCFGNRWIFDGEEWDLCPCDVIEATRRMNDQEKKSADLQHYLNLLALCLLLVAVFGGWLLLPVLF